MQGLCGRCTRHYIWVVSLKLLDVKSCSELYGRDSVTHAVSLSRTSTRCKKPTAELPTTPLVRSRLALSLSVQSKVVRLNACSSVPKCPSLSVTVGTVLQILQSRLELFIHRSAPLCGAARASFVVGERVKRIHAAAYLRSNKTSVTSRVS